MEKDKTSSDDFADYYGSGVVSRTKKRVGYHMSDVEQAIENLLEALKRTKEYTEYQCQLQKINMQPELRKQVDAFRNENFELQNSTPEDQMLQRMEQFEEKYQVFRENPLVNDFLEAELSFCRKMQEVTLKIMEGLAFE